MRARSKGPILPAGLALSSSDVYLSARGMIKNFGDEAETHAGRRAQAYADSGDSQGSEIWLAIATAIGALRHDPTAAARKTGTQPN